MSRKNIGECTINPSGSNVYVAGQIKKSDDTGGFTKTKQMRQMYQKRRK